MMAALAKKQQNDEKNGQNDEKYFISITIDYFLKITKLFVKNEL